eukprot:GHVU01040265.1.p1 GENE.GHVU01040265.1~~GHVU01040265.1.p1  ORF type:complete len:168 (-),score=16.11 GHVU01040265.1:91-594(-)
MDEPHHQGAEPAGDCRPTGSSYKTFSYTKYSPDVRSSGSLVARLVDEATAQPFGKAMLKPPEGGKLNAIAELYSIPSWEKRRRITGSAVEANTGRRGSRRESTGQSQSSARLRTASSREDRWDRRYREMIEHRNRKAEANSALKSYREAQSVSGWVGGQSRADRSSV